MIQQPTIHSINPLQADGFQFEIVKLPEIHYFNQGVSFPGVSLPSVKMSTPSVEISFGGETPEFEPLTLTFQIDEDLSNYIATFNWMLGIPLHSDLPNTQYDFTKLKEGVYDKEYSDASLHLLSSSNNIIRTIEFYNIHPVALSGWELVTTNNDSQYVQCTATFEYTHFKFVI